MSDQIYTLRINSERKAIYTTLARENGYSGLAGLIKDLLDLYTRNQNILDPTTNGSSTFQVVEEVQKVKDDLYIKQDTTEKRLNSLDEKIDNIQTLLMQLIREKGEPIPKMKIERDLDL